MLRFELKRLVKGSLIYGIGGIIQKFIGLLLLPLFTRVLTPEEYGIIALLGLVSVGFSGLFNLGTGNSIGVIYYREEDRKKRSTVIWSNAVMLLGNSLLLSAVICVAAPQISLLIFETDQYTTFIRISVASLALITITEPFYAYLRMEEKAKQFVVITLVGSIISIILSVILVLVLRLGVMGLLLSSLLGQFIVLGVVGWMVARKLPFMVNQKLFAPLVRIGFPSIFGLFAFLIVDYADRQMLQRLVGLDELGIYSIGYSFGMIMMVFVGAFGNAWTPFFMSFINRREDAKVIFGKVLKYYIVGFGLLVILFFAAAKPIMIIMVAPEFHEALKVIGLVAAAYMLKGCYLLLLPGIYFAEKLKWQSTIEWVAALLNIKLNLWLIPLYGITGAACATLISYMTLPLLTYFVSRQYLSITYEWLKLALALIVLFTGGFASYHLAHFEPLWVVIILSTLVLMTLFFFLMFIVLSNHERNELLTKVKTMTGGGMLRNTHRAK